MTKRSWPDGLRALGEIRKAIGAVAGIVIEEGADRFAYRKGFFVIGRTGETVAILNDQRFQPKVW